MWEQCTVRANNNFILPLSQLYGNVNTENICCSQVKFENEEAEDAGGVTKEFFLLLLREILDPKYGMFCQYEETQTIWFSEDSFEDEVMYYLIGELCQAIIH